MTYRLFGLLWLVTLSFSACELLDEDFRQVPYLLEVEQAYEFSSQTGAGIQRQFLDRSDFDVPSDATIEKFVISDINLQISPAINNRCSETRLFYAIENEDGIRGGLYEESFSRSLTGSDIVDGLIADFSIANKFDQSLTEISSFISMNVKNDKRVSLSLFMRCDSMTDNERDILSFTTDVDFDLLVEYTVCEDVIDGSDLKICI